MRAAGVTVDVLDAPAMRARFPAFRFADGEVGFVDERAGSLRASRCVRAVVSAACAGGATLRAHAAVRSIEPSSGGVVALALANGSREIFERVVVCAGPWSSTLLPHMRLPLRVTRQQYVHLAPTSGHANYEPGAMPIWIDAQTQWYGFPRHGDVGGVKIASHDFGDEVDPGSVDRSIDAALVARTRAYARDRLPALAEGEVVFAKTCLYTVSPDEDFIVDAVLDVPGCFFVAGCSGHAFKFGPLLGTIVADLARDREPRCDITRLRMHRFASS